VVRVDGSVADPIIADSTGVRAFERAALEQRVIDEVSRDTVCKLPESWGDCTVFVLGKPGATLKLSEYPFGETGAAPVDDGDT